MTNELKRSIEEVLGAPEFRQRRLAVDTAAGPCTSRSGHAPVWEPSLGELFVRDLVPIMGAVSRHTGLDILVSENTRGSWDATAFDRGGKPVAKAGGVSDPWLAAALCILRIDDPRATFVLAERDGSMGRVRHALAAHIDEMSARGA